MSECVALTILPPTYALASIVSAVLAAAVFGIGSPLSGQEKTLELPERLLRVGGSDTSRMAGSPEPPPPFRAKKAEDILPPTSRLITFKFEPGTGKTIYVDYARGAKSTRLQRYDPMTKQTETLLEPDELIYSIEFHPKYSENGYLFLGVNGPVSGEREDKRGLVTRITIDPRKTGMVDPATRFDIIEWSAQGHNGGAMAFDPDGLFYVTTGDGTSDSDGKLSGQRLDFLLAKVLRIDVDHPDPGKSYSVPPDNPFIGRKDALPEVWAYGFRNPWRACWDPVLNRLWVGNNGQDRLEQAYLVERGANYGWSVYEGSRVFYADRKLGPTPVSPPTVEHGHHEARSLTGGLVYTGERYPMLKNAYVYGDYATGKIWAVKHDGEKVVWNKEIADTPLAITDFGISPEGDLLVADYRDGEGGGIYRLVPNVVDKNTPPFPKKLSETGFFVSVSGHQVRETLLPYDVIAPQWVDGAYIERYLALPKGEPRIGFTPRNGWEFPDDTVVIQSLAIGEKGARRWVETRLLSKVQNEWAAYSYAWNEAQTDAELVAAEGIDRTVNGKTWRFEARSSCMVCHSRAANFVLGLQTAQINRDLRYTDTFSANQLEVVDQLGFFRKKDAKPGASSLLSKPAESYDRLVDPFDTEQDLNLRARSYLHAFCSHCHIPAGGGNAMMDLRHFADAEALKVVNEVPNHGVQGLAADARIVLPGDLAKSVLFHRIVKTGPGRMPPMGSIGPSPGGVTLLLQWILALGEVEGQGNGE